MSAMYPEQITIDVDARLHLQHVDVDETDHYIQPVSGTVISYPNAGEYEVSLSPANIGLIAGIKFVLNNN